MTVGDTLLNIERAWARRVLLVAYVPFAILYNILWHGPKRTMVECFHFIRIVWKRR